VKCGIPSVVSILIGFGLFFSGCADQEEAPPTVLEVKVVKAVTKDVPIVKEWVGQTSGAADIEIRARVAGWLQGLHFVEGTEVKKNDLLYTIDQSELLEAVAEANGRLAQAQTLLARAKSDVDRYGPLAAQGAVSKRDLEAAEAEYGARQGEVAAARASLNVAEINLSYATIRAPSNGLIGLSTARVGEFVGRYPNPVILTTLSRIDTIHVRFSITEQEYLDLSRRMNPDPEQRKRRQQGLFEMILADGSLYPERGSLLFAQRQVDAATGTLQMEAGFPNPHKVVRPGQFARIRAVFDERKSAIVVPARAVLEIQGQPVLYTVDDQNKVHFQRIQAGPKVGQLQVIEEGLKDGETVIVEGIQRVRPDMIVKPVPAAPDSLPAEGR
jgi:membrane fusion protein (multidrug efflux system)